MIRKNLLFDNNSGFWLILVGEIDKSMNRESRFEGIIRFPPGMNSKKIRTKIEIKLNSTPHEFAGLFIQKIKYCPRIFSFHFVRFCLSREKQRWIVDDIL